MEWKQIKDESWCGHQELTSVYEIKSKGILVKTVVRDWDNDRIVSNAVAMVFIPGVICQDDSLVQETREENNDFPNEIDPKPFESLCKSP